MCQHKHGCGEDSDLDYVVITLLRPFHLSEILFRYRAQTSLHNVFLI